MKKLILGAALAASAAFPALAQITIGPVTIGADTRDYIVSEKRTSVVYDGTVEVGTVLPADVEVYEIRDTPTYRYTVVNDRRVIVDPGTRRVVHIID